MIPVLVIRHAPTDWNAAGLIQGRADPALSDAGRAAAAAMRLPVEWAGAACLSSPLRRCVETASQLSLDPLADPRLIEMDWGAWEGERLADLRRDLGPAMAANEARGLDFRPPGGESPREVQERVRQLLVSLKEPAILLTHKGVLRAVYALATGWDMRTDPATKLRDGAAHQFAVDATGAVSAVQLNIALQDKP